MFEGNSISILCKILTELSESKSPDELLKVELARCTNKAMNDLGFSKAIMDLMSIFKDAEKTILTSENAIDPEGFVKILNEMNLFFLANNAWDIRTKTFNNWVQNKNILRYLRLAAGNIEKGQQKIILTEDFLEGLLEQIHSLEEEVVASEISKDIQSFVLSKLREISWAIENYHVYGAKSIKVTADSVFSEIFNKIQGREIKDEDRRNKHFGKFTSLVWMLLVINSTAIEPLLGTISFVVINREKYLQPNIGEVSAIGRYLEDAMIRTDDLGDAIEEGYLKLSSPQQLLEGMEPKLLEPGQDS